MKLLSLVLTMFMHLKFCISQENSTITQDEYKCSLPDVTSIDDNLDITRFRSDFSKISEVKFPGLIGPLNERLICKIKCIDGNWVGPLCSTTPDGRFQPILRECFYRHDNKLLSISFKNSSIDKETYFPHGSVVISKCKHFGLYKIKGESHVRCENGEWSPKFPECVPTTLVTNFTAWANNDGEQETNYRLTLTKMSARHSDQYTCTSPAGHTNTVTIKVVSVVCPPINVSSPRIRQFAQGWKLGHSIHFSCQPGFHLNGSAVINCMGSGHWSTLPPTCEETFCPSLKTLGPHLSVVEYNSSFGGRAVFQCAWGYRLVGVPGLECELDGLWSGDIPHCIPIYCPNPLVPEKVKLLTQTPAKNGKYLVGDLITYACDEGYQVLGESSIVCTENGFWSHPPPFCLPPSEIRKADTIYIENTTLIHIED
ncbi:locomotion-related protein Hikaru genki isoform X2 [Battus philenor]|uniref:locomotion-related protein Hikaru genki isoform X2 n=1 Tax=Battus philenor TaxID=42288 RepID=UPI0035CF0F83